MTKGDTSTHIDAVHVAVQRGVSARIESSMNETYWTVGGKRGDQKMRNTVSRDTYTRNAHVHLSKRSQLEGQLRL